MKLNEKVEDGTSKVPLLNQAILWEEGCPLKNIEDGPQLICMVPCVVKEDVYIGLAR